MGINSKQIERSLITFTVVYMMLYYAVLLLFANNEQLILMVSNVLQLLAPLLAGSLLLRKFFQLKTDKIRFFWLMAAIATFSYGLGMAIFRYNLTFLEQRTTEGFSGVFFLTSIILFLSTLIYVISINESTPKAMQYIFDILIVMVVTGSITWYYVIEPILSLTMEQGLLNVALSLSYPIGVLGVLFAVLNLYYSAENLFPARTIFLILAGFLSILLANMTYLYLTVHGIYEPSNLYSPLWPFSMLLFGLASFYDSSQVRTAARSEQKSIRSGRGIDSLTLKLIFPYISVIIIFLFMITEGVLELNSIVIGAIVSTLLIIVRQIFTMIQNNELLFETQQLNRELELKVNERTKELYKKNQQLEASIKEVEYIAYHDSLTSLTNRRFFEEHVQLAIDEAQQSGNEFSIMFIDLDRFKFINDTLGHFVGDLLLIAVAKILKKIIGEHNIVSRQGGDEFMILLKHTSRPETERIANRIVKSLENPISVEGNELYITSSIGISMYPANGTDVDTIIKRADTSMYSAKEEGKNCFQFFSESMDEHISLKVTLENGLRKAVEENELKVAYQPKLELASNQIVGMEALLRWRHSELGNISPATFIPLAEETGLIIKLGDWVLRQACLQLKEWHDRGMKISVSVNVSTIQFIQKDFVGIVKNAIQETFVDPEYLELEITESSMTDTTLVAAKLKQLKQLGIKISVDDFGSGYSSLSHIKDLPIDVLKIDKSFIQEIENEASDRAIVSTILALAANLNLTVIAEGVENEKQFQILKDKGCDQIQGYFISKPVFAEEVKVVLENKKG